MRAWIVAGVLAGLPSSGGDDWRFEGEANRSVWTLNGKETRLLDLRVKANGPNAVRAVAYRSLRSLQEALGDGTKELAVYQSALFGTGAAAVDRVDEEDPSRGFEFDIQLIEPKEGVDRITEIKGELPLLVAEKLAAIRIDDPFELESKRVKHELLTENGAKLEIERKKMEVIHLRFSASDGTKITGVDVDTGDGPFLFWHGTGWGASYEAHIEARQFQLDSSVRIEVRFEDSEGKSSGAKLPTSAKGTADGMTLESSELSAAGIEVIAFAKPLDVLRVESSGKKHVVGPLSLRAGEKDARILSSSTSTFAGAFQGEWTLAGPAAGQDLHLLGSIRVGLAWTKVPIQLRDIAIRTN